MQPHLHYGQLNFVTGIGMYSIMFCFGCLRYALNNIKKTGLPKKPLLFWPWKSDNYIVNRTLA